MGDVKLAAVMGLVLGRAVAPGDARRPHRRHRGRRRCDGAQGRAATAARPGSRSARSWRLAASSPCSPATPLSTSTSTESGCERPEQAAVDAELCRLPAGAQAGTAPRAAAPPSPAWRSAPPRRLRRRHASRAARSSPSASRPARCRRDSCATAWSSIQTVSPSELKRLFSEHKLSKRVRVGLATPRTVLRVIDLPPLDDKDIRTALIMQAQERIPMPLDRAVMDFHKVGLVDTADGQRLRVIVVVTEREGVDVLLDTLRRAGLKPEGIDLSVFSVIRSLNHHVDAADGPGPVRAARRSRQHRHRRGRRVPLHAAGAAGPGDGPGTACREPRHPARGGLRAAAQRRRRRAWSTTATSPWPTCSSAPRWSSGPSCVPRPSSTRPSSGQRSSPPVSSRARWPRCPGSSRRCRPPRASS